jgi:hypothetical protein
MKNIGTYKYPIMGCAPGYGEVVYRSAPYFGIRQRYLWTIKKKVTQILVKSSWTKSGFVWINVDLYSLVKQEF